MVAALKTADENIGRNGSPTDFKSRSCDRYKVEKIGRVFVRRNLQLLHYDHCVGRELGSSLLSLSVSQAECAVEGTNKSTY